MRHVAAGLSLIFRGDRFLKFVLVPMIISGVLWIAAVVGLYFLVQGETTHLLARLHLPGWVIRLGGSFLFLVIFFFTAAFIFLWLASVTNSKLWTGLSHDVEMELRGAAPRVKVSFFAGLEDMVLRTFVVVVAGILAIGCGWTCLGIGGLVFACCISLTDYTSAFYLRRGITYRRQIAHVVRLPGSFGFAVVGGLLTMVPFLNIFMLPVMVAGGTAMGVEAIKRGTEQ